MSFKIMVVDDEPAVLKLFKNLVQPLGFEVLALENSREAAQRVESQKFDGFFLDARMPAPDGFELTRRIRASRLNGHVPIIMLTGFDDVETMRQGFRAGVTFFLGKPFSLDRMRGVFCALRSAMLIEKRRWARLPLATSVTCRIGQKHFRTNSVNVSEGGILLEWPGELGVGQVADLEFRMPDGPEALQVRAKVVRKEPLDRMELEFVEPPADVREKIRNYVAGVVKR